MTDYVKTSPHCASVEQLRDYLEWHVQNGRGAFALEIREHYMAIPPVKCTHDDQEQRVFLRGVYPIA